MPSNCSALFPVQVCIYMVAVTIYSVLDYHSWLVMFCVRLLSNFSQTKAQVTSHSSPTVFPDVGPTVIYTHQHLYICIYL